MDVLYWMVMSYNSSTNWWTLLVGIFSAAWYSQIHPEHPTKYHWAVVNTLWLLGLKFSILKYDEYNITWYIIIPTSMLFFALELAYGVHLPQNGKAPGIFVFLYACVWFFILAGYISSQKSTLVRGKNVAASSV